MSLGDSPGSDDCIPDDLSTSREPGVKGWWDLSFSEAPPFGGGS